MTYFEFQAFTRSDQGPVPTHILYQLQHTHKKKKHALKVEKSRLQPLLEACPTTEQSLRRYKRQEAYPCLFAVDGQLSVSI